MDFRCYYLIEHMQKIRNESEVRVLYAIYGCMGNLQPSVKLDNIICINTYSIVMIR